MRRQIRTTIHTRTVNTLSLTRSFTYIQRVSTIALAMTSSRDGPNPLRPYYIPRPIEIPGLNTTVNDATAHGLGHAGNASSIPKTSISSSARDILSDLDYGDYLGDSSPSVSEALKGLLDQGLWKYTSVLLAQPFEVAKTVLQVQDASSTAKPHIGGEKLKTPAGYSKNSYDVVGYRIYVLKFNNS